MVGSIRPPRTNSYSLRMLTCAFSQLHSPCSRCVPGPTDAHVGQDHAPTLETVYRAIRYPSLGSFAVRVRCVMWRQPIPLGGDNLQTTCRKEGTYITAKISSVERLDSLTNV